MNNERCKNCKWGNCLYFSPNDYFCAKFKMKPSAVYYEGQDCEKCEPKVGLEKTATDKKLENLGFGK